MLPFTYSENGPLLFTHAFFWVLFGVLMLAYQFTAKNLSRNLLLLLFSLYFYYLSSGLYFLLLLFSSVADFWLGKKIYAAADRQAKWRFTALSVALNLGLLGYFKYTYFFADTTNVLFDTSFAPFDLLAWPVNTVFGEDPFQKIFLPVGISFYTFQTISYTVDIYRNKLKPLSRFTDFALYVSFFPQLVAGPIVRAAEFLPQLHQPFRLESRELGQAVFLILNGLVKKICVSDYISVNFVDRVFGDPLAYTGIENLLAVYGYSLQIYCDFSGYTDMAIGLALLLGFRLPINFNSPYKARNITDFWRRWHISLSSWLRDYLYIPLGGSRHGPVRTYVNLLATMLLGGLWHGAHLKFILWGGLHCLGLAVHKAVSPFTAKKAGRQVWPLLLTFHFTCFCWIFFRAADMETAMAMLRQLAQGAYAGPFWQVLAAYWNVLAVMLGGFALHFLPEHYKTAAKAWFCGIPDFTKACLAVFVVLLVYQFSASGLQPFIYFQF